MTFTRWFADALRFARRDVDMSQRELARWSGVAKSTIARAELGQAQLGCETAAKLLATLGFQLTIRGPSGETVEDLQPEWRRDCVGRRFPPHLDLIAKRDHRVLAETEQRKIQSWSRRGRHTVPASRWTFRLDRSQRDAVRAHGFFGELGTVPRAPRCLDRAYLDSLLKIPWLLRGLSHPVEEAEMVLREWPTSSLAPP